MMDEDRAEADGLAAAWERFLAARSHQPRKALSTGIEAYHWLYSAGFAAAYRLGLDDAGVPR